VCRNRFHGVILQTETILASAVQQGKPSKIDNDWIEQGMAEERASGLARAMFCVRLLEQSGRGSLARRMSFLLGAFIASDLDSLLKKNILAPDQPVILVGPTPLARARKGVERAGLEPGGDPAATVLGSGRSGSRRRSQTVSSSS